MENRVDSHKITEMLKNNILRLAPSSGSMQTAINGLKIARRDNVTDVLMCFYKPMVIVMLQGQKHIIIGSEEFVYGENQFLVTGVELPTAGRVTEATAERPALAISLELDSYLISRLAASVPPGKLADISHKAVAVTKSDPDILDAFLRLLELLDRPEQQSVMAPLIIREIHYRLLMGPLGNRLRSLNTLGSSCNQVSHAITWLKENYKEPMDVNELAEKVNMAQSTFHRHFKDVTTISPLQYQKRLRLFEAQRLMLAENMDATNAGYSVGYESAAQFNREYKRMFGEPPKKDIKKLLAKAI